MDQAVDPCDSFYDFACGRWDEHHSIPGDRSGFDTMTILRQELTENLRYLFETESDEKQGEDSRATEAVRLMYESCMDSGITTDIAVSPGLKPHFALFYRLYSRKHRVSWRSSTGRAAGRSRWLACG